MTMAAAMIESPNLANLSDPEEVLVVLKLYQQETGLSLPSIARAAGLHFNSLNRAFDPTWRPRVDTLKHLYAWLSGLGRVEDRDGELTFVTDQSLEPILINGNGWSLCFDNGQWWIETDDDRIGPYDSPRPASADAQALFPEGDKPDK